VADCDATGTAAMANDDGAGPAAQLLTPMSAIASFIKLPKTALDGLREAAVPKKRLFGSPRDTYHDYLRRYGREVADYKWSGYVLATLLVCLQEEHEIDLMHSDYDQLSTFLTESRGATHFIFTDAHKRAYLPKLDGEFSEKALCDYFNAFNASSEAEAGRPMLDGVRALRRSVSTLDAGSVVVFSIG
jgi:hypothetical protein